mgnify:CR=1 FL=1
MITYDEHGGFFDHVPPPQHGVPPPDGHVSNSSYPQPFCPHFNSIYLRDRRLASRLSILTAWV